MTDHRRILAIHPDPGLREALTAMVAEAPDWRLEISKPDAGAALRGADAVVVQLDLGRSDAIETFQRLARSAPEGKILAIVDHAAPEPVRQLFRAGVADVISAPFTPAALRDAVCEILQQARLAPQGGQVISVIKGCGGAGATTVALNLAALSAAGDTRRSRPGRSTAVLDLDLQFGDSDIALDLEARTGVLDLLRAEGRVDQRFFQSVLTEHRSGLKLLAPTPTVVPLDALDGRSANAIIDHAATSFSRTFIDLPGGWSEWTFPVLARSDAIIVVTQGTVAGAFGARRVLRALRDAAIERPVLVVLNRIAGLLEGVERPASIAAALQAPIDASLPADGLVGRAADRGRLLVVAFPKAAAAKGLRTLADRLEARLVAAPPPPVAELAA